MRKRTTQSRSALPPARSTRPAVEKRPPCSVELTNGAIYFFCKLLQRIVVSGTAR